MAVVEELIGRLTLQTKGIKDAREAVKAMEAFRRALQGLAGAARVNFSGPANAAKGFKQVIEQAKKAAQAQKQIASSADFGRANAGLKQLTSTAERLRKAYIQAATAQRALARAPTSTGRSWIQGEIDALRQYQRLQRQVNSEAGRRGVPRARIERGMTTRYGGSGHNGPLAGRVDTRGFIDKGFDEALTTPQIKALLRSRLANEKDPTKISANEASISKADALSRRLAKSTPEFSQAQHMQGIYGTMGTVGSLDKAIEMYPAIAEYNAVIEGLADKYERLKPYAGGASTKDFARIFDSLGRTDDPQKVKALGDAIIKGVQGSSGEVVPSDFLMAIKYLRTAKYGVSDDFIQNYMPGIIGDVKVKSGGASSAGTGLASLYDQFYNLRAKPEALENLHKLGLIDGDFSRNKKGKINGKGTAQLKNRETFRKNMQQWMNETMESVIRKKYKLGTEVANDDDRFVAATQDALGKTTSNRVAADTAASMLIQKDERERDAKIARTMPGIDSLKVMRDQSPVSALQSVTAAIKDFASALVDPAVPAAVSGMQSVSKAIRQFTSWKDENPELGGAAATAGVAGTAVAGAYAARGAKNRLLNWWRGGGTTPGSGTPSPPTTPVEPPGPTTSSAARPVVGPQMSAMDIAARNLAKAAAAAAIPVTTSLGKGEQDALVRRLGAYAESKGYGRPAQTTGAGTQSSTTPNPVAAAVPNTGAVEARLSEIQSSTQSTADRMKESLSFTAKPEIDTGGIDAAIGKAEKLKALLDGAKSAAASAASGIGGNLVKSGNAFPAGGATTP